MKMREILKLHRISDQVPQPKFFWLKSIRNGKQIRNDTLFEKRSKYFI